MDGCFVLGDLYYEGKGVKQNYQKAAQLYQKSCDGWDSEGCYNLGVLYENGYGVKKDNAIAKKYYGKACDLGLQKGCDEYTRLNNR